MIPNGERWPDLEAEKLSALLEGITSKRLAVIFIVWIAFILSQQKRKQSQTRNCENKNFCNVIMLSEDTKILEFNQYQISDKAPFIIYVDLECMIEKIDGCKNNPENSSTKKGGKHIPSGFSMFTILPFKYIENKHDVYKGKGCMKKFCEYLREHTMNIINFKRKKWVINKRAAGIIYKNTKICYKKLCKEKFENKCVKDKTYHKFRDHIAIIQGNIELMSNVI